MQVPLIKKSRKITNSRIPFPRFGPYTLSSLDMCLTSHLFCASSSPESGPVRHGRSSIPQRQFIILDPCVRSSIPTILRSYGLRHPAGHYRSKGPRTLDKPCSHLYHHELPRDTMPTVSPVMHAHRRGNFRTNVSMPRCRVNIFMMLYENHMRRHARNQRRNYGRTAS